MIVSSKQTSEGIGPDIPDGVTHSGYQLLPDGTYELFNAMSPFTYKADIWRRCTDAEAEVVDQILLTQPVRLQRLWNDSTMISHSDELFPLMWSVAVQAFGEARAAELLAPSG